MLLTLLTLAVFSCGSDSGGGDSGSSSDTTTTTTTASPSATSHNQGLDCLYCHVTVFTTGSKQLLIGGTVFKSINVSDIDNVTNTCNASINVQFLDSSRNVVYDSLNYIDTISSVDNGTGNIFILSRKLSTLTGEYYMRLVTSDNTTIAQSSNRHTFTDAYGSSNPTDLFNRYSCNACHTANPQGGAHGYLYPNVNSSKCY
ncbi:hypothetical protein E2O03_001270 [Candidatus Magnetomonas plexicatena]|nr:hypothetical protein E2O03_001270 [Nitrospirales bacterium LBB_01]